METKGFLIYLVSGFSIAILSVFFLNSDNRKLNVIQLYDGSLYTHRDYFKHGVRVWPDLEFNWRSTLVTIVGFLGSAFGTVGGVGGGGIFVPMLNLIVGFDAKSAAALSKCMIMGASASSFWYNIRVSHPTRDAPIIDYDLAVLFQPMLMLGITIGVSLSVIFPYWLITLLIIILFMGTSSRSFCKGIRMWKDETILLEEEKIVKAPNSGVNVDADYEALVNPEEKTGLKIILFNIRWMKILVLIIVWILFLLLQALKNQTAVCSPIFWVLNILQVPVAIAVFMYEAIKLNRDTKNRILRGNTEPICEASIQWTPFHLLFCAVCGLCGGTVGGLLGSGGGFILGPLLLEIGVIPQVASATATFVMLFSSSLSVVEFYFLKRFPMLYAMYLIAVSMLAGFWGQFFVRKMVKILNRASIIVFILSAVIVASALTMGIVGIEKSIYMINHHQYMGFFPFCQ